MHITLFENIGSAGAVLAGTIMLVTGVIIFTRNIKRTSNLFFLLLSCSAALWSILLGVFESTAPGPHEATFLVLVYVSAAVIPFTLLFFSFALATEKIGLLRSQLIFVLVPFLLIVASFLFPGFMIKYEGVYDHATKVISFGSGFVLFIIYTFLYISLGIGIIAKQYRKSNGIFRRELRAILVSIAIAVLLTITVNLVLPNVGIVDFFWTVPVIIAFTLFAIGFFIVKYNFGDLKLVATEFFSVLLVLTLAVEIMLATSMTDFIAKVAITILIVFSSIFLVRSVRNEVEAKEEVERLLKDIAAANENLQMLDKRKSEFLSIASHHLRDPLTAIKGYASMLIEGSFGEMSDGVKDAMQKIFESSKRLVRIIEDFLNISQIEQGEMAYQFEPVDFKQLVADVIDELSPSAARGGLWLHFIADGITNEGSLVRADAGKIRQVVTNLIDNSIKYTPHGGVRVILAHTEVEGKRYVQLSVTDTGIGMDKATQQKIFNKFSRAEGVSRVYTDGSGLGLYVAREILKKHDGRIWAESEGLGKGSTFYVVLPANIQNIQPKDSGRAQIQI
jgi:signal transduction histidine kinase